MSLENREKSCVFCHAYLFDDDDVVYCPVCGAPHHRECYDKINKCALEELHGTENQYDKVKKFAEQQEEPTAEETPNDSSFEFDYGPSPFGGFSEIDLLGGVHPDTEIEEGVTARDAAKFVFSNTMRYIPKFKKLHKKHKRSWNFMAFFFPGNWMLSRKMYVGGIIACALKVVATLLCVPFSNLLVNNGIDIMDPYMMTAETVSKISGLLGNNIAIAIAVAVGSFISVALCVYLGIRGDWIYKKHVVKNVKEINKNSTDKKFDYSKKGGVNILMFLIGEIATQNVPYIVLSIAQLF